MNDGGPAFPVDITITRSGLRGREHEHIQCEGMTLRDYFAAQAVGTIYRVWQGTVQGEMVSHLASVAGHAYALADAMLEARKR